MPTGEDRRSGRVGAGRGGVLRLDGLRGIYEGENAGVLAAARRVAEMDARVGVGPTRFAAHAAAQREAIVPSSAAGDFLARLPVSTLAGGLDLPPREAGSLIETMRLRRLYVPQPVEVEADPNGAPRHSSH